MATASAPPRPLPTHGILLNGFSRNYASSSSSSSVSVSTDGLNDHAPSTSASTSASQSPNITLLSRSLIVPSNHAQHPSARPRRASSPLRGSPSRRIRFAPLPDPRRAVLVTEDGDELPLPAVFDDDADGHAPTTLLSFPSAHAPASHDLNASLLMSHHPATASSHAHSPAPSRNASTASINLSAGTTSQSCPASPAMTRRTASPHRSVASSTSTPTATPTLAKKLLRSLRRNNDHNDASDAAAADAATPLTRWTSASSDKTVPARVAPHDRRPATRRMLNGRLYGGGRNRNLAHTRNVFANIKDDEPAFVEWGQGGMGAVAHGAGRWAQLQQSGVDPLRGRVPAARAGAAEDEDDGSGLAWLRRRRAEREARERAQRERANETSGSSASSTASEGVESDATDVTLPEDEEAAKGPAGEKKGPGAEGETTKEHEHTVVSVPPPTPSHGAKHTHPVTLSRTSTIDGSSVHEHEVTHVNVQPKPAPSTESESDSEEDDEENDDDRKEDEDDEEEEGDEEDDEDDDGARKTALGAGVEVVSRHHH